MDYIDRLNSLFGNDVTVRDGKVSVAREGALASDKMDTLVRSAVFGETEEREYARWLIWEIGQAVGVRAGSIHDLYMSSMMTSDTSSSRDARGARAPFWSVSP